MDSILELLITIIEKQGKNRDREFITFNDLNNIVREARQLEISSEFDAGEHIPYEPGE